MKCRTSRTQKNSDNQMSYSDSDVEPPTSAGRLPSVSFAIQASSLCHLWTFLHAGQRRGIDKSSNESNTIASVLSIFARKAFVLIDPKVHQLQLPGNFEIFAEHVALP